ncbi:ABC transporter permease [Microbulbifer sp. ZKSA004]|uniref:ABC transporter permease n=1 Tax=Microbulbifer sp. ZKSA004 TaxID=3243389 RepID=UPI0040395D48
MNQIFQYFRLGYKSTLKSPIFALTISLTIGLTAGSLGSIFNLSYLLMYKPLPYDQADELYLSNHARIKDNERIGVGFQSYPGLIDIYKKQDTFEESALIQLGRIKIDQGMTLQKKGNLSVSTSFVTPEYFSFFSAEFSNGNGFTSKNGLNTYTPVAVISHNFWMKHLGGIKEVIGHSLLIEDKSFKIIGVLSKDFIEPKFDRLQRNSELWLPIDFNIHDNEFRNDWTNFLPHNYLVGKISSSQDSGIVDNRINQYLLERFSQETKGNSYWSHMKLTHHMITLEDAIIGESRRTASLIFLGLLGIFLLALGNVTNLFVARSIENKRFFSIKIALGASRDQLFLSILCEALALLSIAFVFSLLTLDAGSSLIKSYGNSLFPRLHEFGVNLTAITFLLILLVIVASIFSWFTIRSLSYTDLIKEIQGSGKGVSQQISKKTINPILIAQITFAGIILCASIEVTLRTIDNIKRPLGFNIDDTYFLTLETRTDSLSGSELRNKVLEVRESLKKLTEIKNASLTNATPLQAYLRRSVTSLEKNEQVRTFLISTDENFFDSTSIPIISGRAFNSEEFNNKTSVAIISEALSASLFGTDYPVGKTIIFGGRQLPFQIIGVAKNTGHPSPTYDTKVLYLPETRIGTKLLLKVKDGKYLSKKELESKITSIDKRLTVFRLNSLGQLYNSLTGNDYKLLSISLILSIVAASITMIGIYGALSYAMSLTKYELGVRMAIGASPIEIIKKLIIDNSHILIYGILCSIILGGILYMYLNANIEAVKSISIWSPILALSVLFASTVLAISGPIYKQLNRLPITYLRD